MIEQRTDAWLAQRAGKLTASAFADLMARTKSGPSASRSNLIARLVCERLTGKPAETYTNAAMQRGTDLEPIARSEYEAAQGVMVIESGFVDHPSVPSCGCSPDGFVGEDGLVELKCPGVAKHLDYLRAGSHAQEYRWQLQGQLWVTGRTWVDIASYHPDYPEHMRLAIVRVKRDDADVEALLRAVLEANVEIAAIIEELRNGNG